MVQVDSENVIKLIIQYLRLNDLKKTADTLSAETGIAVNVMANKRRFLDLITDSRWDLVMSDLNQTSFTHQQLVPLFTLIYLDLIQKEEKEAARVIIRDSACLRWLKSESNLDEYLYLESLLRNPNDSLLDKISTLRKSVVEYFENELEGAANGSCGLLAIINDALRWKLRGESLPADCTYDIYHNRIELNDNQSSSLLSLSRKFEIASTAIAVHPSGDYLCVGNSDGFVRFIDIVTGLDYQRDEAEDMMAVPAGITCCQFSRNGTMLAVGTVDGSVAVWKVTQGATRPVRFFSQISKRPINSVDFTFDGNVLACSDALVLLGIKSGGILRQISDVSAARVRDNETTVALASNAIVEFNKDLSVLSSVGVKFKPSRLSASNKLILVDGGLVAGKDYRLLVSDSVSDSSIGCNNLSFFATKDTINVFNQTTLSFTIPVANVQHLASHPNRSILFASDEEHIFIYK